MSILVFILRPRITGHLVQLIVHWKIFPTLRYEHKKNKSCDKKSLNYDRHLRISLLYIHFNSILDLLSISLSLFLSDLETNCAVITGIMYVILKWRNNLLVQIKSLFGLWIV